MNKINITKASGEKAPFQIEKVRRSLERSGANKILVEEIIQYIEKAVYDGMTTKKIYQMAFKMLKGKSRVSASKYKLKKAIMELGPTGYPFEKFVGKILEHEGFQAEVGVIVQGHCVQHEVDVAAIKDNKHYMIECKYHSDQGRFCNVKRFTTDAIQFGTCMGLGLVSWDYPKDNSLKYRIDKSGLHPLTALTTLTKAEKTKLLDTGIVLCKELHEKPELLKEIGINKQRHKKILEDSEALCKSI